VSILVAGFDDRGPSLYQVDPSGSYFAWFVLREVLLLRYRKATAIGKNMINAKTFLEKRFNEEMELEDAVHTAIITLKEGYEGAMTDSSLEIGIAYTEDEEYMLPGEAGIQKGPQTRKVGKFRRLGAPEIKDYLANIA
jgi:20S proteasome subunit alpha 2